MRYSHDEVVEILSGAGVADPEGVITGWLNHRSLVPVDPASHATFVLSFPVEVSGRTVATVTLASPTGNQSDAQRVDLMCKYMGVDEYFAAYQSYSHETHQWCYFQVHEDFKMPELVPGMQVMMSHFRDAAGNMHEYRLFWGQPANESDCDLYSIMRHGWHVYFFAADFFLQIGNGQRHLSDLVGNNLGEQINKRIADRARALKINLVNA
jgi:hypothetical protein